MDALLSSARGCGGVFSLLEVASIFFLSLAAAVGVELSFPACEGDKYQRAVSKSVSFDFSAL